MSGSAVSLFVKSTSAPANDSKFDSISPYLVARQGFNSPEEWTKMMHNLSVSTTVYVGNLGFATTEVQILAFFSIAGPVKRIIMVRPPQSS